MNAAAEVACAACGEATPAAGRFCIHCAAPLAQSCPECGAAVVPGARFCLNCAAPLAEGPAASSVSDRVPAPSERRLVSVLFADLVGFTSMSERLDPEEVRELMGSYYDRCRSLIERYGGAVEKFIGDAVMAVWGSPVAREDDAERAVRAALSLTAAVTRLGEEVGMPELRVRAGVLTGHAAVDVGSEHEGMVLGDTVNTASRLQSIAAPGTVLVDDVTRRASEAAIAYEDAGEHMVKGREQLVRAWTALRVVAGAGGARRSAGLEAPLVGRDRELAAIIEAGERSAREGRAGLVAVVGEAGAGKSRLLWEFFKALDGIEETRWWHQGRCLSYGEGVAYLGAGRDGPGAGRHRRGGAGRSGPREAAGGRRRPCALRARATPGRASARAPAAPRGAARGRPRRPVQRLAPVLRADGRGRNRSFWPSRTCSGPTAACSTSSTTCSSGRPSFPIFVIALGRTELRARRPGWEPISLGSALAPGRGPRCSKGWSRACPTAWWPRSAPAPKASRSTPWRPCACSRTGACSCPRASATSVSGDVSELEVPETLQALVASRLDGLSREERQLLQDAAVLGQSFAAAAVAALSERREADVVPVLDGLVAKQVLSRDDDPRSPERGQYAFLQTLLRTVAYGTLARRTRKAKHLSAARYLRATWPGELIDIAEVLASHDLAAIRADPGAEDVGELRASAREALTAAGRAAASLALGPEADRYIAQAADLAEDDLERAEMFAQAGFALWRGGDVEAAERRLRESVQLRGAAGQATGGAAAVTLSNLLRNAGRAQEARMLVEPFRDEPAVGSGATLRAEALTELAVIFTFLGQHQEAAPLLEEAMTTLEHHEAWPALAQGLLARGVSLIYDHRRQEAIAVTRQALALAEEHDLPSAALRAHYNLAGALLESDRFEDALREVEVGLTLARERGDRVWEAMLRAQSIPPLTILGRWDLALRPGDALLAGDDGSAVFAAQFLALIAAARGDGRSARALRSAGRAPARLDHIEMRSTAVADPRAVGARQRSRAGARVGPVGPRRSPRSPPRRSATCLP